MRFLIIIAFSLLSFTLMAQSDSIKLDDLVQTAIANNYNIKIAKNNLEMASNVATIGMAGFLPTGDVGANYTYTNSITNTTFLADTTTVSLSEPSAATHNYGANVNLRYTLFDGLKPVYKLQKSKIEVQLGNNQYQQAIENTIYTVLQAYYTLASLQEDERIAKEKMALTNVQIKRIETKRKYGQGSEVELLNLQTAYNTDSTQLLRVKLGQRQAIRQLNKAIGSEEVDETMNLIVDKNLDLEVNYDNVWEAAQKNNLSLVQAERNIQKSKMDYKIATSELFPKLNTVISYGYNGSNNDVGLLRSNSTLGPSISLGLTYVFYSGGQLKPTRQNAKLTIKNAELNLEAAKYDLEQSIKDAWVSHQNNMALIPIEQGNVAISKQSFERTTRAYQLGQATYLQYQQAQLSYLQAQKQVITAELNAKLSEWELRRLAGELIGLK